MLMVGVALRSAIDGRGALLASATDTSIRDVARRIEATVTKSPAVAERFPRPNAGPGSRGSSWNLRQSDTGGWLGLAAAGSASQLASRTAAVAVADEVSRWPARVRSGEGHPLALLRARLMDWGDAGRLLCISSPVLRFDAIDTLFRDGDRRRLEYACTSCGSRTPFAWEQVNGRERGETPAIACARCGELHDERARRRMLRTARWTSQRADPVDEDVASFTLGRLDSARSSLGQVVKEWRRARRAVERGDRDGLKVFRNTVLGLPGESGAADVDKLFERRERTFQLADIEQVAAGIDVQDDRLVHVVAGFNAGNADVWILDHGVTLGDPRDDEVWSAAASNLARPFGGLPVSVVSVDAGHLTTSVRQQCGRRRWWLPVVGRSGRGAPIARKMGASGVCTMGRDDVNAWWSGRAQAGKVHLPMEITRAEIAEICAAEALVAKGGTLKWEALGANHLWDAGTLAVHARHFRPLTRARRPLRLVAV